MKMRRTTVSLMIFLMLTSSLVLVKPASSETTLPTIFIQPDGSIYPTNAPIQRDGNSYTFTDNIHAAIKILKSGVVLNGAGYTLSGPFNGTVFDSFMVGQGPNQLTEGQQVAYVIGVDLGNRSVRNIVVENLNVKNFSIGMYMWTENNTVRGNAVFDNIVGMLLSGSNNTIVGNIIADNKQGLFFGFNNPGETPSDIFVYLNSFEHNEMQMSGCNCQDYNFSEPPHNWDNGEKGNYWSDYTSKYPNATQVGTSGIGDTTYWIDPLDRDRFPLMQNTLTPPTPKAKPADFPVELILLGAAAVFAVAAVTFALRSKRPKNV
jgi:cold shock CspA family protein